MAIERTIHLAWDGVYWRDRETGVIVTGIMKPTTEDVSTEWVDASDSPNARRSWILYDPSVEKVEILTRDQAQAMITDAFRARVIPEYPAYFFEGNWLVTYDWLMHIVRREMTALEARLQHNPWWKLW